MGTIKIMFSWVLKLTYFPIGLFIVFWPSVLAIYVGLDLSFMHMHMFTLVGVLLNVIYFNVLSGLVSVQLNKYNFKRIQSNKRYK